MRILMATVLTGMTLLGGLTVRVASSTPPTSTIACDVSGVTLRHHDQLLELTTDAVRRVDLASGARIEVPSDQVLVDTERGPLAVFGDEAVDIHGACAREAALRVLANRVPAPNAVDGR